MSSGLELVRTHVDSFFAGRTHEYARQVTPDYRHHYLPDNLGQGPDHVRRWREILFSIYGEWRVEIADAHDDGDEVIIHINFMGRKPCNDDMPLTCESSAVLLYEIEDGKLSACNSLHQSFDAFDVAMMERFVPDELH